MLEAIPESPSSLKLSVRFAVAPHLLTVDEVIKSVVDRMAYEFVRHFTTQIDWRGKLISISFFTGGPVTTAISPGSQLQTYLEIKCLLRYLDVNGDYRKEYDVIVLGVEELSNLLQSRTAVQTFDTLELNAEQRPGQLRRVGPRKSTSISDPFSRLNDPLGAAIEAVEMFSSSFLLSCNPLLGSPERTQLAVSNFRNALTRIFKKAIGWCFATNPAPVSLVLALHESFYNASFGTDPIYAIFGSFATEVSTALVPDSFKLLVPTSSFMPAITVGPIKEPGPVWTMIDAITFFEKGNTLPSPPTAHKIASKVYSIKEILADLTADE